MPYIQIRDVVKSFKTGKIRKTVLKGISMNAEKGEFVAIVGRSGSGKSTFLNILGGLDTPDSGTIMIDGIDIASLQERELCDYRKKHVGFVFQSYHLIPVLNVIENIELPQIEKDTVYVEQLLDILGIGDKRNSMPNELSGGQQQRVAIARALVNRPEFIIADEPTGNLDSVTEKAVIEILKDCRKKLGTTIVMVTHNMEVAESADRIVRIQDGEISNG